CTLIPPPPLPPTNPLSLHDALPILLSFGPPRRGSHHVRSASTLRTGQAGRPGAVGTTRQRHPVAPVCAVQAGLGRRCQRTEAGRSEEHTSELQSRENLVCRLLLEKK